MLKDERDKLVANWYINHHERCYSLFPDDFSIPFSPLHDIIIDKIHNSKKPKRLILAPRGIGKTSLCREACCKKILFREAKFILYISNSLEVAEMQTENIKSALLSSQRVKKFFGSAKTSFVSEVEGLDESFSKKAWVAFGHTLILPRGAGQQIRGLNWRGSRPDFIILDDPENANELENETNRIKYRRWFFSDVAPAKSRTGAEILYIDTLKHEDCLPVYLIESGSWDFTRLEICGEDYKSLAPDFMSDEEIASTVAELRACGGMDIFYREYRNLAIAAETAKFKREFFKYYEESELTPEQIAHMENFIVVDPAKTTKATSDRSAIVGVGIDQVKNICRVRDVVAGLFHPDELYDEIFAMAERLQAQVIGIEVNALNEFITYPFYNEMARRGLLYEVVELTARGKKEGRIAGLVPLYRLGLIWHNKGACTALEDQLLTYPVAKHDDISDALAYIIELAAKGGRFMHEVRPPRMVDGEVIPEDEGLYNIPTLPPYELEGTLV